MDYKIKSGDKYTLQCSRLGWTTYERESINECLLTLHRLVPYSWDHAFKYEGWYITDQYGNIVMGEDPNKK